MADDSRQEQAGAETPGKHDLIVAAARKLFLESGYGAVSMDAIALEAGVSKRTVYSHFQNKETLFAAVVGEMCREFGGPAPNNLSPEIPPKTVLTTLARQILGVVLKPEALALFRVVVAESKHFPELGRLVCEAGPNPVRAALTDYFTELDQRGELRVPDPKVAARLFIGMVKEPHMFELVLGAGECPTDEQIDYEIDQAVAIFLNGLRAEPR